MQARKKEQSKEEMVVPMLQLPKIIMPNRRESYAREVNFNESYVEGGETPTGIVDRARREVSSQLSARRTIRGNSFRPDKER